MYLWKEILEEKGYKADVQEPDIANTFTGVADSRSTSTWTPGCRPRTRLEIAFTWYEPAERNLRVPTYVKDVDTITDLKAHASEFGGWIVGIEAGSGLTLLTPENVMPNHKLTGRLPAHREQHLRHALPAVDHHQGETHRGRPAADALGLRQAPLKVLKDTKGALRQARQGSGRRLQGFLRRPPRTGRAARALQAHLGPVGQPRTPDPRRAGGTSRKQPRNGWPRTGTRRSSTPG